MVRFAHRFFLFLACLLALSGCSTVATVKRMPPGGEAVAAPAKPIAGLHAHLVDVKVAEPFGGNTPLPAITQWQDASLKLTGLFEAVRVEPRLLVPDMQTTGLSPLTENYVEVRAGLTIGENLHFAGNVGKAMLGGLTLYTATPLLSYYYDSDMKLAVEVTRRDGVKKVYQADAGAQVKYGFWANKWLAPGKAKQAAMTAAGQSVIAQMIADREFFAGTVALNLKH